MWHLIVGLTLIVIAATVLLYFGIRWIERPDDETEPTEHGDGES